MTEGGAGGQRSAGWRSQAPGLCMQRSCRSKQDSFFLSSRLIRTRGLVVTASTCLQLCSSVHFLMKEQPAAAHNGSHRPPFVSGVYRTACLRDPNPRFTERHPAFLRLPVHG